jgi:hypothetical protein
MWLPVIEKHIRSQNILLDYKPFGAALGVSTHNEILVRPGMSSAETFSTLIHELTHVLLHHGPNRAAKSKISKPIRWPAWCARALGSMRLRPLPITS